MTVVGSVRAAAGAVGGARRWLLEAGRSAYRPGEHERRWGQPLRARSHGLLCGGRGAEHSLWRAYRPRAPDRRCQPPAREVP